MVLAIDCIVQKYYKDKAMKKTLYLLICLLFIAAAFTSCNDQPREIGWLEGTTDEMLAMLADQFGGFDQTMIEVGYRYNEIYWAGQDENWEYALYQLDEMTGTLEAGFIRRPAREESADMFMNVSIPELQAALEEGDPDLFQRRFESFTSACNTCHLNEDVRFMYVKPLEQRQSPIHKEPS